MKRFKLRYKILAVVLTIAFTFQTMSEINSHTYTTGFSNFHSYCPPGITCCFAIPTHSSYECGKAFHIH